jgi:hypothetical protein
MNRWLKTGWDLAQGAKVADQYLGERTVEALVTYMETAAGVVHEEL